MRNVINVSNVSVKYGDKLVIKNVSFSIGNNSIISIVGLNGSGKSTLLKVLCGLVKYDGYININGYVLDYINVSNIRQGISFVRDDVEMQFMGETVYEDLIFNMENLMYTDDEIEKRVMYISELFGISDLLNMDCKYISNSERQRVAIASSLMGNPSILLLDDCFHQLSVKDKKEVIDILRKYKKENKITIIMALHNMEDALYSDRVMVMNKGSIVYDGSVIGVFNDKKLVSSNGIKVPFVVDLSMRLIDKGVIEHIYLDMGKLVRDLWK